MFQGNITTHKVVYNVMTKAVKPQITMSNVRMNSAMSSYARLEYSTTVVK